ncbi:hypothetical protein PFHG_03431 [Plasmodium falciparum HB3]|uniref:Uncharacterized protein n=1 Tax=Plasmodium falciparum (isolate HB3) TaxID=137071 RepID=A0A0L7KFR8_PLAFX|nr:hypothetical protein PFHG_03431 [Plasmodium falciparum HB3]
MIINYFNKLNKITFKTKRKNNMNTYLNLKKYIRNSIIISIKHNYIRLLLIFNKLFLFKQQIMNNCYSYYIQEQPEISHSFSYHIEQPLDVISQFQNNVYELSNIPNEFNFNYHNVKPREDQFYNNINTFLHHYPKEHNNIQTLQNSTKNEEFYDKANKNIQENFYNDFVKFKDYIINDKDQNIEDINITGEDKEKLKLLFETLNEMKFYESKISALNFKYYYYKNKSKKKKKKKSLVKMALTPIFVLLSMFTLNKVAPEVFSTAFIWLYRF